MDLEDNNPYGVLGDSPDDTWVSDAPSFEKFWDKFIDGYFSFLYSFVSQVSQIEELLEANQPKLRDASAEVNRLRQLGDKIASARRAAVFERDRLEDNIKDIRNQIELNVYDIGLRKKECAKIEQKHATLIETIQKCTDSDPTIAIDYTRLRKIEKSIKEHQCDIARLMTDLRVTIRLYDNIPYIIEKLDRDALDTQSKLPSSRATYEKLHLEKRHLCNELSKYECLVYLCRNHQELFSSLNQSERDKLEHVVMIQQVRDLFNTRGPKKTFWDQIQFFLLELGKSVVGPDRWKGIPIFVKMEEPLYVDWWDENIVPAGM